MGSPRMTTPSRPPSSGGPLRRPTTRPAAVAPRRGSIRGGGLLCLFPDTWGGWKTFRPILLIYIGSATDPFDLYWVCHHHRRRGCRRVRLGFSFIPVVSPSACWGNSLSLNNLFTK